MIDHRALTRIVERIVALYDPDQIYLFGSYAKGMPTPRSDLDFVVIKRTDLPRAMRGRDVIAILAEVPIATDLLFVTPEELELERQENHSLLATIMPTALLLYQRWPTPTILCADSVPFLSYQDS